MNHLGEEEDKANWNPSITLWAPLAVGIWVGEILEEEAEILETQQEVVETPPCHMTNYQGSNPLSSKETDTNQKDSSKNGTSIRASIGSPHKW